MEKDGDVKLDERSNDREMYLRRVGAAQQTNRQERAFLGGGEECSAGRSLRCWRCLRCDAMREHRRWEKLMCSKMEHKASDGSREAASGLACLCRSPARLRVDHAR